MLIQQKLGHIDTIESGNRIIDWLPLEWFETSKRILRKRTVAGHEVTLKFLAGNPHLTQGDVLYEDDQTLIVVDILPSEVLVVRPTSVYEMASVCYEIGNKHLPLFFEDTTVLIPYEAPLFRLLTASGYAVERQHRKLLHPLKTTVAAHGHTGNSESLFAKILRLTTPSE